MAVLDDLLKFIAQYQALLAKNETKAAVALAKRYKAMYARIAPHVEALAQQISAGEMTAAEVRKLKALATLETQIPAVLRRFQKKHSRGNGGGDPLDPMDPGPMAPILDTAFYHEQDRRVR